MHFTVAFCLQCAVLEVYRRPTTVRPKYLLVTYSSQVDWYLCQIVYIEVKFIILWAWFKNMFEFNSFMAALLRSSKP